MSRDGWATIGVGLTLLTVLVAVAGLVFEGQSALHDEIANLRTEMGGLKRELRGEIAEFRKELRAENAQFRDEIRAGNAQFRDEMRAGNARFRDEMRVENAEFRKEIRAEIGKIADETAQLRIRVTRLEVLVGMLVERMLPNAVVPVPKELKD